MTYLSTPPLLKSPPLIRCLASLFYELLLIGALLLAVTAVLTPLQLLIGQDILFKMLLQVMLLVVLFFYFCYCWVQGGQTLAMKAWRIKLVNSHGGGIGWKQAAVRYLIGLVLFIGMPAVSYLGAAKVYSHQPHALWLLLIGSLAPFFAKFYDRDYLFLHDRLAGTRHVVLCDLAHSGQKRPAEAALS